MKAITSFMAVLISSTILSASPNVGQQFLSKTKQEKVAIEYKFIQSVIPNTKFEKYKKSFIDGFYDVYLKNGQIIYVNPYKDIVFFGEIYNKAGFNYTASQREKWEDELAQEQIKKTSVKKLMNGTLKINYNGGSKNDIAFVMFTDPLCPFCQKAEKFLATKAATVYYNFLPLPMHKDADKVAMQILSSEKPKQVMANLLKEKLPNNTIKKDAKSQLSKMMKKAQDNKINSTPIIFVINKQAKKVIKIIKGANIELIASYIKD